jgi:transcriptional regulator with GAF, ATPase, and Fis domain
MQFGRSSTTAPASKGAMPLALKDTSTRGAMTPALKDTPSVDSQGVPLVLSEIAAIASETLELREVFPRVAAAVRRVIPFDDMGVVRIVEGDRLVLHATTMQDPARCEEASQAMVLDAWSPRWRPRPGPNFRIDDARAELDRSYPMDAKVLAGGMGAGLWEPFQSGNTFTGGIWLCADETYAFTDEHQEILRPIAALLGSALEHWKIWDRERRRQERLNGVEALLRTLAESLDVREVFQRLSDEMQPILPHHMMVLTELGLRAGTLRIVAATGDCEIPIPPEGVTLTQTELERRTDFEIIRDIPAEFTAGTERERLVLASGLRSWLRVPVRLSGEVSGGLSFLHREPCRYDEEDAEVARRLADRIALALSFHRLAEEARIAREAQERAERLEATVETLARELEARGRSRVVGDSGPWRELLRSVGRVAASETTVLVTGESGTGKEVISRLVHQGSPREGNPFVAINCAALPEQLLESELFGHEKGAFTGAVATKIGRIEQAAGGTLFLDEIGEMSPQVQAKFLRVLEEREFQRLGGTRTLKADVRVIAATNRDLSAAIARQEFREDLFYRLNVFSIHIPPLRERIEDILPLAESFLEELGRTMGRPAAGISRDARQWLLTHPWPGNARELRNAIERAILLCDGGLITRAHLPAGLAPGFAGAVPAAAGTRNGAAVLAPSNTPDAMKLDVVERGLVVRALTQSAGNKSKAARLLGLSRAQLYWRIEKYGLD